MFGDESMLHMDVDVSPSLDTPTVSSTIGSSVSIKDDTSVDRSTLSMFGTS